MYDFTPYVMMVGILAFVVTAVVEAIKTTGKIDKRYLPILSCFVGVAVGLVAKNFSVYSYYTMGVVGFISGLASCGLFDLTKLTKKKEEK
jgi:hypothetical protein